MTQGDLGGVHTGDSIDMHGWTALFAWGVGGGSLCTGSSRGGSWRKDVCTYACLRGGRIALGHQMLMGRLTARLLAGGSLLCAYETGAVLYAADGRGHSVVFGLT